MLRNKLMYKFVISILALSCILISNSFAFKVNYYGADPIKWRNTGQSEVVVPIEVNENGSSSASNEFQAIQDVIANWNLDPQDCSMNFLFDYQGTSYRMPSMNYYDYHNVIGWLEDEWPYSPFAVTMTSVWSFNTNRIYESDTALNGVDYCWSSLKDGEKGGACMDVGNAVAYGLGETLGLRMEMRWPLATMYGIIQKGETLKRDPWEDDLAGFCALYPSTYIDCSLSSTCDYGEGYIIYGYRGDLVSECPDYPDCYFEPIGGSKIHHVFSWDPNVAMPIPGVYPNTYVVEPYPDYYRNAYIYYTLIGASDQYGWYWYEYEWPCFLEWLYDGTTETWMPAYDYATVFVPVCDVVIDDPVGTIDYPFGMYVESYYPMKEHHSGGCTTGNYPAFTSSNTSVLTVDNTGIIHAVKAGTATVTARCNGWLCETCQSISVTYIQVSASPPPPDCIISITPPTANLSYPGGGSGCYSNGLQFNEDHQECVDPILWYSDNTDVVTVNPLTGFAQARGAGTASIYAYCSSNTSCYDVSYVLVDLCPCQINIYENNITLYEDGLGCTPNTIQLTGAMYACTDGTAIWSSSNPNVATVDSSTGFVTAVNAGSCVITAACSTNPSCFDTCNITVQICPCYVDITQETINLSYPGGSNCDPDQVQILGVSQGCAGTFEFASSDPDIAIVDEDGLITATGVGNCTITVWCSTNPYACYDTCYAVVNQCPLPPCNISITDNYLWLCEPTTGATTTGILTSTGCSGNVNWFTSNIQIGTVNPATGATTVVTAVAEGECYIQATCDVGEGCQDYIPLTIWDCTPACQIYITPRTLDLCAPGTGTPTSGVLTSASCTGTPVWVSSDSAVATVQPYTGNFITVTAVSIGTCVIRAYCPDADVCLDEIPVTVWDCTPPCDIAITSDPDPLWICAPGTGSITTGQITATLCAGTVNWQSMSPLVADVDPDTGPVTTVTAYSVGTADIWASCTIPGQDICFTDGPLTATVWDCGGFAINPSEADLCLPGTGDPTTILLTTTSCDGEVTWENSDPTIATIAPTSGATTTVTAVAAGTCTITATCPDDSGSQATAAITVADCTFVVEPMELELCAPGTGEPTEGILTASNCIETVTWSSTNTNVATVSPTSGDVVTVTAVGVGTCKINAACPGHTPWTKISITVNDCSAPDCLIEVTPNNLALCGPGTGATTTGVLTATLCNGEVTWATTNGRIATVDPESGATTTVTAVGLGMATVTGTCPDGLTCQDATGISVTNCSKK